MGSRETIQSHSWLSLVAETAGVSGATVARVELQSSLPTRGPVRAVLQIHDTWGRVIGASAWEGDAAELNEGVVVDLGCDLGAALGSRLIGWVVEGRVPSEPRQAIAPEEAAARYFEPGRAMKLMLRAPSLTRAQTSEALQAA